MAKRSVSGNRWRVGVAFSLPLIVGLCALTVYPVVSSFWFSVTDRSIFTPPTPRWVGAGNYKEMLAEPRFWLSVGNTAYFSMFSVPLGIIVGLMLALLLNLKVKGLAFFSNDVFSAEHRAIDRDVRAVGADFESGSRAAEFVSAVFACTGELAARMAGERGMEQGGVDFDERVGMRRRDGAVSGGAAGCADGFV